MTSERRTTSSTCVAAGLSWLNMASVMVSNTLATNIAGSAIADELFLSAGKRGSKIPLKPANILYKYIHTDEIHVDVNSATTPWRMPEINT